MSLVSDLNSEQKEAVLHEGGPLLIFAGAGSGKTRVICHRIAHAISARGVRAHEILAVTFTNKAAGEMRGRVEAMLSLAVRDLWISTFHSSAARILRRHYAEIGGDPAFTIYDDDDQTALLKSILREMGFDPKIERPAIFRERISRAKDDLLTADGWMGRQKDVLPTTEKTHAIYLAYEKRLRDARALDFGGLLMETVRLLSEAPSVRDRYRNRFRMHLIDEFQDTNRAQYEFMRHLAPADADLAVVGDDDQCLAHGTLIRTPKGNRAVEKIRPGDLVLCGAGGGRLVGARVGRISSRRHRGTILRVILASGEILRLTSNHICFARLSLRPDLHHVYLMYRRDKGFRIGVTRGRRAETLRSGVEIRANQEGADKIWILRTCATSAEARYYEQYYCVTYGIPSLVFHVRGRRMALTQDWIDRLYREVDTLQNARGLFRDLDLDPRYPHHRPSAAIRGASHRLHAHFTMFGDPRRTTNDHRIQLISSDPALRRRLEKRFRVRSGARGTWRIETSRKEYDEALSLARSICERGGIEWIHRARLDPGPAYHFQPASHLRVGMTIPVARGGAVRAATIRSIVSERYDGPVYDLSVPNHRNYAAGGILVHNSIYRWRGARIEHILHDFRKDYPEAKVVVLRRNYRSGAKILDAASRLIARNASRPPEKAEAGYLVATRPGGPAPRVHVAETEYEEADWIVSEIERLLVGGLARREIAVFYRVHALSRVLEETLSSRRIPYQIAGGVSFYQRAEIKDLLAFGRVLSNAHDAVSWKRVFAATPGLGGTSVAHLEGYAATRDIGLGSALARIEEVEGLRSPARRAFVALHLLLSGLRGETATAEKKDGLRTSAVFRAILERSRFLERYDPSDPEDAGRIENVEELLSAAAEWETQGDDPTLAAFLENLALASAVDRWDPEADRVTLATVHAAKGLEYGAVFVAGLEEGLFPHIQASRSADGLEDLEEERRLAYVAMTRAKDHLSLSRARTRRVYGEVQGRAESRFLCEAGLVESVPSIVRTVLRPYAPRRAAVEIDDGPTPGLGDTDLFEGDRVLHRSLGVGRVLGLEGAGEEAIAMVQFKGGVKRLLLRYAGLQRPPEAP